MIAWADVRGRSAGARTRLGAGLRRAALAAVLMLSGVSSAVAAVNLTISKTDAPDPVTAASNITYTINYANTGTNNASAVVVRDTVPASTTFVSATGGGTLAAGVVTWNIGNLAAGAAGSVQLVVKVNAGTANNATITNGTYSITSTQMGPVNGAPITTTVHAPTLAISKTDAPDPVAPGANITYTLSYSNSGGAGATGTVISDTVPANTTFVSATGGGTLAGGVVTWNIGAVAAGGSGSVQMVVQVGAGVPAGTTITNGTYSIIANETTTVSGAADSTTVQNVPVLTATKVVTDDNGGTPRPGEILSYTITITNSGLADATSVVFSDPIPANATYVPGSLTSDDPTDVITEGNPLQVQVGTLTRQGGADNNVVITFDLQIGPGDANGAVVSNQATITAAGGISIVTDDPSTPAPNDATSITVVNPLNISFTKSVDKASAKPGDTLTYTLSYGNTGTGSATNVSITDVVPSKTTFVSATGGGALSGSIVTWSIGTVAAGGSGSRQFTATINAGTAAATVISNSGTISFQDDLGNTQSPKTSNTVTTTVLQGAGVAVNPDQAQSIHGGSGNSVTYTFTVTNTGNGTDRFDLTDVVSLSQFPVTVELLNSSGTVIATDNNPANGTWDSVLAGADTDGDGLPDTGNIAAGTTLTYQVRITEGNGAGNAQQTIVSIRGTSNFDATVSDTATFTTTVNSTQFVMDLSKTDAPDPVASGSNITYTIVVRSNGSKALTNVVVTDPVPANTTFVSASAPGALAGGVVTWNFATIAAGASQTLTLTVNVPTSVANGTVITNTVSALSTQTATTQATTTTTVQSPVSFATSSKAVNFTTATPGTTLTYTIAVTNSGINPATGVVVADTVPANTTYVPGSITGTGANAAGNPNLVWNIGNLAAGATTTLTFQATINNPVPAGTTTVSNTASITSNQTSAVSTNTATTNVTAAPNFTLSTKSVSDLNGGLVATGDTLRYTLVIRNSGNMSATGVVVTDTVPANTTYVAGSITGTGADASGNPNLAWTIGPLAGNGGSTTLTFDVVIGDAVAGGTVISNLGSVSSAQTSAVNTSTASVTVTAGFTGTLVQTATINPGGAITMTLTDRNLNTNPATVQTLTLTTVDNATGESETRTYTETGANTGVFTATVATVFGLTAGANNDGTFNVKAGDTLTTTYNDAFTATGGTATVTATTTVTTTCVNGSLSVPASLLPGQTMTITVTDADRNANPAVAESFTVSVNNPATGETETVTLTETGINTGVFSGTLGTSLGVVPNPAVGVIAVANGNVLTTTYGDTCSATGGPSNFTGTTTIVSPVLTISKTDAPDPVAAGANITYTISYANTGTAGATGVVISDTVPANTTFVSATGGGTLSGGVVTWNIGALAAGASASVQLVVQVVSPLVNGTVITNGTYSITSNEVGPVNGAADTTTVTSAPVLGIAKTDAPDPVAAGANITYTIAYSNTGNANATGVVISDTVPANTTFVSATGGGTLAAGVVTWNLGALSAGGSGSVQLVVGVVSPLANATVITNGTYSINSNEAGPVSGAADTTTVTAAPILGIAKTDAPDPVAAGANITYTISYSNTGNANATGVVISDTVPANTTFVSATGGGTLAGGVVTWNLGALNAGTSGSVQLVVQVTSPLVNGTVIHNSTYSITSTQVGPVSGTDDTTTVTSAPVLSLSKTDAPDPVAAGANITYTIAYSNTGNANATGVVISDTVPANTTFVSATGGGTLAAGVVTWNIGVLSAGASASVQLVVKVNSPLANGTVITNGSYTLTSNEAAPVNGAADTTTVTSAPILAISKTDAPDPVAAGGNITYTIAYSNTGNASATGVVIRDTLPANTTFVSATGGGTLAAGVVSWNIGLLGAGTSTSVQLVVKVDSPLANGTVITNGTYSITSNEVGPVSGAADTTTVTSAPVLSISKTDAPDPVAAGNTITYTISYSNTGNQNATAVVISDTVPANTTFSSATGGGALAGGVVTWNIGALAAGASGSVQLVVQVNSPLANGTVIHNNTYSITSAQVGPVNGADDTTTVTSGPILTIGKTDAPDPAVAGTDNITYTLSYSNIGNANATGVLVRDTVPAGTTFVSATAGGTLAAGVVTWNIGNLNAGVSGSVQMVVSINTPVANNTTVTNGTYSITSNEVGPVSGAADTTTILSDPRFVLTKTDAPDPVAAGSNITYTLSYQNVGTNNGTGTVISDPLPANTSFVSATAGGSLAGGVVTWNVGTVNAGASGSVQLVVKVASPLANGTVITNTGWNIDTNETLPQTGPDATTTVTSAPVLTLSKTDAPDPVVPGNNITYTISYSNTGNENATGAAITDAIPANTTFVSATGGGTLAGGIVTWTIGAFNAGVSGSVQLVVQVTSPLANGTVITNGSYQIVSNETAPTSGAADTTTVNAAPALSIAKTDAPDPVVAGANITYTLSYSNTGTQNATGVTIGDTLPANTSFVSATGGGTLAGSVVTWNIGALAVGASGSVQLVVKVASPLANGTVITNGTYSITSNEVGPVAGAADTTTVSSAPILSVSKTDAPDPVAAGANITYTISYSNTGNANATSTTLSDTVPANTTFVSATGGGTLAGGVVTWSLGTLGAGASGSVQLVVKTNTPLVNGTVITNGTYSITSAEAGPVSGAADTTTVTSAPVLSLSKSDAPDPVNAGSDITYTITYSNTGNANATGVVITDTVPTNTSFVSATGGGTLAAGVVTWNIGGLAAGASASVQLVVRVNSPLANGTLITNGTYSVTSNEAGPVSGAAVTTTVSSAPVLGLSKSDAPDPVNAGSDITYTITYSNTGNANATGVVITDTVPTNTTFVSATAGGTLAGGVVTWNVGALGAGGSGSVQLVVRVNSPLANGTTITNATYAIVSNETAPLSGAAITTTVSSAPVLAISKTDAPDPVAAGGNITYTIAYSNTGNANATGTVITDTLPANTTFVSATGGGTLAGGVVTWNVGLLAAGASTSVQLVVKTSSPLANGTVIANSTYGITSNEAGPVSGAADTTTVTSAPILSVSKVASSNPVAAGNALTYTISYSNAGNENATNAVLSDTVPANTTFVSATGGGTLAGGVVTWNIGALNAGVSGSVQMVVQVNSPLANGTVIANDTYSITSTQAGPVSGAAVDVTVTSGPILNLGKTDAPDPAVAGTDNITYTLSYSNTGNANATGVLIRDTVPAGTTFVSATAGGTLAAGVVTWNVGNLNSGVSGSVQMVVSINTPVANGATITNATYSITSNETGPVNGAADTTTVLSSVRFTLGKTAAPNPVAAGSDITYTLSYQNTGTSNATGVILRDPIPANTTFVSATAGGSLAAGVVTWNIGPVAAGASASVQLVVKVASPLANGTVVTNTAWTIVSNESLTQTGPDASVTVTSAPVLAVSKTDAPDPVNAGGNITYTIAYSNSGNENATGVTITDALPTNTTFVSATGGGSLAGSVVTWTIGALNTGVSGSVQLVVKVSSPLANGTVITNGSYQIACNEIAPVAGAADTTTVSSAPALSVSKTDAPDPVNAGSNITYTITYANTGTDSATGVVLSDTLPANTTFVSATGGGTLAAGVVTWNLGTLAAGASGTQQLVVQVTTPLANGTVISNATYSIRCNETGTTAGAADTTTVNSVPVLSITKTGAPDPVAAGANLTYTLSWNNTGTADATSVVVSDTLPANTAFVSATGGGVLAGGIVTWNVGTVAAGGSGSVQLVVKVASPLANGTLITNGTYSIRSAETGTIAGPAISNTVTSSVVLSATKAFTDVNGGSLAPGDLITYTITVRNSGNADATGVNLSDAVPANTTLVAGSLTSDDPTDVKTEGNPLTVAIGTLNGVGGADSDVVITFQVRVNSPLANGTVISNQATITAAGGISIVTDDPSTGAANDATARPVVSAPVLAATKTAVDDNGGSLIQGDTVTYTITVRNSGNADATSVNLSDPIPANTTLVAGSLTSDDPTDVLVEGNPLTVAIGTLSGVGGADSDVVVTFKVRLNSPLAGGVVIGNQGTITAAGGLSIVTDDPSTPAPNDPTNLTTVAATPAITVTETVADLNGGSLNPGDTLRYTLTIGNTGTVDATSVVLTNPVPANTTFVSATGGGTLSGGNVTWNLGTVAVGATVTVTFDVTVDAATPGGTVITSQATLTAAGGLTRLSDDPTRNDGIETGNDPADPGDDDPTITAPVFLGDVLRVAITADQIAVRRGDFVLYTITLTNPTSVDVTNVTLSDRLPVGVSLVPGTLTLDGVAQGNPTPAIPILIPIGTVAAGQTRTLTYRAVVNAGAQIGDLTTRAHAQDAAAQALSSEATHDLPLIEDPEFDLGTIVGKVFDDKDGNGVQGAGERGIGGVMVAMEDGVYALTDGNGLYHIAAVRPGNRLVKINVHTLPPNDGLTLPEAQTITLTPGLLTKVNFGVRLKPPMVIHQGAPGTYGVQVQSETLQSQAEVIGNLEDMTAVVNGVHARLPKARVKMDVMSLERNLRIVDGRLDKPATFRLSYPESRPLKEWTFEIFDESGRRIRGFTGTDLKTREIVWDGKDFSGALVKGGSIYQYQFTLEFADGSLSKSPLRMFGVNRTSAISFELTGASFETNTATLKVTAKPVLDEIAATLSRYPDEKVVVRGHTDSTGARTWNERLSLKRAQAVKDYLVAAGVDGERLVVQGAGAAMPVATNATAEGRARNRRVEIKAMLEDTQTAAVLEAGGTATEQQVVVNGKTVPTEADGSFRTTVDPMQNNGKVYVGIKTDDGGVAAATVSLPSITILQPTTDVKVEIGKRDDLIKLMQPKPGKDGLEYPTVGIPVRGRTEPGNQIFIDGTAVPVQSNGVFETRLPLAVGENTFGVVAVSPGGDTSLVNLAVNLSGVDKGHDLVVVRKPVPQFSVELPPRGAVLSSPSLFVRGTAPKNATVTINHWRVPVQPNGTFAGNVRLPEGPSVIDVVVNMPGGTEGRVGVPVTVQSNYFFLAALGDATVNKIKTDGNVPDQFKDDLYVDGRVALYLKGRIQGKYLLTAGLDTGDGRLNEIGSRLGDRNNSQFFRNLDPDAFYPVYGDSSRTVQDVNSQGRFYVLFEAPAGTAEWGNFQSGITGNEFSSFNRTLYGGKATWRSLTKGKDGQPLGQALVFAALPETRSAHDEFLGTGGSLYFLRNKGVVPGSEKVRIEVRDKITGIVVANVTRRNYVDYEIDYVEGRLLFRTPVSSVADSTTVISDGLLNGNPVFVIVDYEFSDTSTTSIRDNTYGARVKQTMGAVTVGATYVQEEQSTGTYTLEGGDVTLRVGGQTSVTAEFSQSENQALPQYVSDDGGLSFNQKPVAASPQAAQAYRFEFATGGGPARATGYYRHIDAGFSSSFAAGVNETNQLGATLALAMSKTASLNLLYDHLETVGLSTVDTGTLQFRQAFGRFSYTAEGRYRRTDNVASPDTAEGIGAIRFDYKPAPRLDLYARYQDDFLQKVDATTAPTGQKRQTTVGLEAQISPKVTAKAEVTAAEGGDSALVGVTTKVDEKTVLYGTFGMSPDQTGTMTNVVTVGATAAVSDRSRLYTEEQFKSAETGSTASNVVGLSTKVSDRLTTSAAFERAHVSGTGGNPDSLRQAGSVGLSYAATWYKIFSKFELREDRGAGLDRNQWVSSNAVEFKPNRDLTFTGRYNYGVTKDRITDTDDTVYQEESVGAAFRPIAYDWIQFLTRWTRIRNLPPDRPAALQEEKTDTVFSFQTVVDLHRRLSLTEKYAVRDRALDQALLQDLKSQMRLWINRFSYHLSDTWDAALEYRTLTMLQAGDNASKGFLLEVNRLFMKHLRLGAGYNFTDFTDNEFSANDYSAKGFFFRIQGKY